MSRVVAPLSGTVTRGRWVAKDLDISGVRLASGKPVHFEYLMPAQFNPAFEYPVLVWLHPQGEGSNWYSGSNTNPNWLSTVDADGMYNTVAFRTRYPCIVVVGYADQTGDPSGAIQNWGGWVNNGQVGSGTVYSGDTGPNVFGLLGVVQWVLATQSGDRSRVYVAGFSLGGHGSEYVMLRYNQVNGNPKTFTAGISTGASPQIHGYASGPSSADVATMRDVPVWWVSGANDTTSPPAHWNLPMWQNLTGNSVYPTPGGTAKQAQAGSSQMHLWFDPRIGHQMTDASGAAYPANTTILDWMFSQSAAQESAPVSLPSRADVLAYFQALAGKGCVSCEFTELKGGASIDAIHTATGKWLGMIGGDYWWYGQTGLPNGYPYNAAAIAYAKAGGLVTMTLCIPNPTTGGSLADNSRVDGPGLVTPGNPTNTQFNVLLDAVVTGLTELQNNGVTVIFRPFHECNGSWFWYGQNTLGNADFIAMWKYAHDRLTITKGLKNLIWVWSPNAGFSSFPNTMARFPGPQFADMTGFDLYTSNPGQGVADYNALVGLNLPVALCEYGSGNAGSGDPSFDQRRLINILQTQMPKVVFWQQWWERWSMINNQQTAASLAMPWVINRDKLNIGAGAPPVIPPVVTPPGAYNSVNTTSGGSLKDGSGSNWTLASDGTAMIDGNPAAGGGGTKTLTVASGTIWGQDAAGSSWFTWNGSGWDAQSTPPPVAQVFPPVVPPVVTPPPVTLPPVTPPTITKATIQAEIDAVMAQLTVIRAHVGTL